MVFQADELISVQIEETRDGDVNMTTIDIQFKDGTQKTYEIKENL